MRSAVSGFEQSRWKAGDVTMSTRVIDWPGVVAIETHQLDLPGVSLRVGPKRFYPFGPLAAHLLGYVGEVSKTELAQGTGDYTQGDLVGKARIGEQAFGDRAAALAAIGVASASRLPATRIRAAPRPHRLYVFFIVPPR